VVVVVDVVVDFVVVFVTSVLVDVACWVLDEVVVFELEEDDDELDVFELSLVVLWLELCWVVAGGVEDWVVPSVATCSKRIGGWTSARGLATPKPNNAATTDPRNAPTASRIGAPR
jgi:hypothetical protein